ncbi:MAG: hypothetical protein Q9188_004813 [Gyalolechia gomerana]
MPDDYDDLGSTTLTERCRNKNLPCGGTKKEKIRRLRDHDKEHEESPRFRETPGISRANRVSSTASAPRSIYFKIYCYIFSFLIWGTSVIAARFVIEAIFLSDYASYEDKQDREWWLTVIQPIEHLDGAITSSIHPPSNQNDSVWDLRDVIHTDEILHHAIELAPPFQSDAQEHSTEESPNIPQCIQSEEESADDLRSQASVADPQEEARKDIAPLKERCRSLEDQIAAQKQYVQEVTVPKTKYERLLQDYSAQQEVNKEIAPLQESCRSLEEKIAAQAQYVQEAIVLKAKYDFLFQDYGLILKELIQTWRRVWVVARIKPLEGEHSRLLTISTRTSHTVTVAPRSTSDSTKRFTVDQIFDQDVPNELVFERISPVIIAALDYQKVCIIADGQSNSGKSYTMFERGDSIASLAAASIFSEMANWENRGWKWSMSCLILENSKKGTYNLLSQDQQQLKINTVGSSRKDDREAWIPREVTSSASLPALFHEALGKRQERPTAKNNRSSRSHLLCTLQVTRTPPDGAKTSSRVSQLCLIDLAGSERWDHEAASAGNAETQFINLSRYELRQVIEAHARPTIHRPTTEAGKLLQKYLPESSKLIYFPHLSAHPDDQDTTVINLDYAHKVITSSHE